MAPLPSKRPLPFINDQTQTYLQHIWEQLPPDNPNHQLVTGMVVGEQAKYLRWDLHQPGWTDLELLQITDVQFGHVCCNYKRLIEYRDWVLSVPNRFMLWTGDMVDAWALWSPGRAFDQLGDPQSQVLKFVQLWAPARHRILGFVGGNHERRAIPGFGDLGVLLATLLRIPYSNGRQVIDVYFGQHKPFKISLWHGVGGARTKGTVAQILHRFISMGDSQLYLMGHVHQPLVMPIWKEERNPRTQLVVAKKAIGAVGSSFMDLWGSYAEVAGYSAGDVLMANTVLEADGGWECRLR